MRHDTPQLTAWPQACIAARYKTQLENTQHVFRINKATVKMGHHQLKRVGGIEFSIQKTNTNTEPHRNHHHLIL